MVSKNQISTLYVEIAPALLAFLKRERRKILAEVQRLQKKRKKQPDEEAAVQRVVNSAESPRLAKTVIVNEAGSAESPPPTETAENTTPQGINA